MNSIAILQQLQIINALTRKTSISGNVTALPTNTSPVSTQGSIKQNYQLELEQQWENLEARILQDLNAKTIEIEKSQIKSWLNQIKANFTNINELTPNSPNANSNNTLQTLLLPIFQLIHVYEKNGVPEDHAKKLGHIFATLEDVLNYLCIFAKQNVRQYATFDHMQLVHNACLFTLPQDFNFKKNAKIQKLVKEHMQDPEFRSLLPNLPEIEKLTPRTKKSKFKINTNKQLLSEKIENVKAIIKRYKEIKDQINKQLRITPEEQNAYEKYGSELLNAQISLTQTSFALGNTFDELSIYELKAYNSKYKHETGIGYKYFLDHELTNKNYTDLLNLTRIDDDNRIPPIIINGADLGYPGTYLRRLNVQSSFNDAIMAACLGKLSDCCQSLSGEAGEPCTIHGLTSPDGGFYVVCMGDVSNPKLEDQLICQSWVWRSTSNALVIDSIEAKYGSRIDHEDLLIDNFFNETDLVEQSDDTTAPTTANELAQMEDLTEDDREFDEIFHDPILDEDISNDFPNTAMVKAFYTELAYKLVVAYDIPKISCGSDGSGITEEIFENNLIPSHEIPTDYNGYRDSEEQTMICDRNSLYLLPNKEDRFFEKCKTMQIPATSPIFIKMICFAITHKREDLLNKYVNLFNRHHQGQRIVKNCQEYFQVTNYRNSISNIIKDPYLLPARLNSGNILHYLAETDPNLLSQLIGIYTTILIPSNKAQEDILLAAITDQDPDNGNNLLHVTASDPKLLEQLLEIFPSNQDAILAIEERNYNNQNVLNLALNSYGSLQQLLVLYPLEARLAAIGARGQVATGLLSLGITCGNINLLEKILPFLPPQDRTKAIMFPNHKNDNGISTLHTYITMNPKQLKLFYQFLSLFPEKDRLKIITTPTARGAIIDQLNLLDLLSLKTILELLPIEDRTLVLTKQIHEGNNILEYCSKAAAEQLVPILDLLPPDEQLKLQKQYYSQHKHHSVIFSNSHLKESPKPDPTHPSI